MQYLSELPFVRFWFYLSKVPEFISFLDSFL